MEQKYLIWSLFLIVCITVGESKWAPVSSNLLDTIPVPKPERPNVECNCERSQRDILICGTNGLTYRSTCVFECDQQKNPRLRIEKQGTCLGTSKNTFRGRRFIGRLLSH